MLASSYLADKANEVINSPLILIDALFDQCMDRTGGRFGEKDYFESLLADPGFVRRIPYLTPASIGKIPHNSLVRYRGLVQDVYNTEYFVGMYARKGPGGKLVNSKYRDVLDDSEELSGTDLDGPGSQLMERHSLLCVPIPGESGWVRDFTSGAAEGAAAAAAVDSPGKEAANSKKRGAATEEEGEYENAFERINSRNVNSSSSSSSSSSSKKGKQDGKRVAFSPEIAVGSPEAGGSSTRAPLRPSHYSGRDAPGCCCLVKVYDHDEDTFRLNDMLEIVGIYSLDGSAQPAGALSEDPMEALLSGDGAGDCPWPASQAPRVHCVACRRLGSSFPLLAAQGNAAEGCKRDEERGEERLVAPAGAWRSPEAGTGAFGAHAHALSASLPGSPEAAQAARKAALSALSTALDGDELAAEYVLLASISRIVSRSEGALVGALPLCLGGLTERDARVAQLQVALQAMVPRCVALQASISTLNACSFQPSKDYEHNFMVPSPLQLGAGTILLVDETALAEGALSEQGARSAHALRMVATKQELPVQFAYCDVRIPTDLPLLLLSKNCRSLFDGAEAVKLPLTGRLSSEMDIDADTGAAAAGAALDAGALRRWWAGVRQLEVRMSEVLVSTAENDFVSARQANQQLDQSDFSRWLTLARLLAISAGSGEVLLVHWARMKEMEAMREQRLS